MSQITHRSLIVENPNFHLPKITEFCTYDSGPDVFLMDPLSPHKQEKLHITNSLNTYTTGRKFYFVIKGIFMTPKIAQQKDTIN